MKTEFSNKEIEFNKRQRKKMNELLENSNPITKLEMDIYNLKYMRYSIKFGSPYYRYGMIRSLDRAIRCLKKEQENNYRKTE